MYKIKNKQASLSGVWGRASAHPKHLRGVHASRARITWLRSPGYGGHASSVFVDEVAAGVEDPAVVEGHEGLSGCGGRVLPILGVGVLQRGELVLPQHLVHNKLPGGATQRHTRDLTTRGLA